LANLSHAKVRNQAPSAATLTPQTVEFDFA
jgi:hypothetical protein